MADGFNRYDVFKELVFLNEYSAWRSSIVDSASAVNEPYHNLGFLQKMFGLSAKNSQTQEIKIFLKNDSFVKFPLY
ncbi:hypothetical protein REIFOR_01470 [Reinekea forsetii]|uniref:Uncharacterized protein n=1 Tax=Reinekea forsetii TaxID=1336806 RepID=A0A2K8KUQ0_9GAMM|nr:hypothetical protein REIFOR_01470 [Reinekea forsetii]